MEPEQTKLFFDSEIFLTPKLNGKNVVETNNDNNPTENKATLSRQSNSFPKRTIYEPNQIEANQKRVENDNWITIIGYRLNLLEPILNYFSRYGNILRYNDTPGNLLYIEFDTPENAQKPIDDSTFSPILINNSYAVFVTKGKLRPQYDSDEEDPAIRSLNNEPKPSFIEPINAELKFNNLYNPNVQYSPDRSGL